MGIGTTGKIPYKPEKRKVMLLIDLPKVKNYKIRFEKEDKKDFSRVGLLCNGHKYKKDYTFNVKEPYILNINASFKGNIIIELNNKELPFPIEIGKDDITLALIQPEEKTNYGADVKSVASYRGMAYNKIEESKRIEGENLVFLQTTNNNFNKFKDKISSITDDVKADIHTLFLENKNIVYGLMGDVSQEFWALKDGIWKDIKGLQFYVKEIKGKMYVILKGFGGLRETLKGTKYLLSNPQMAAFAVNAKDLVSWNSIVNGTKITIIISSAFSLIDYFITKDGKTDFTDIMINLFTGIGKAAISYWIGIAGALAVIALAPLFAASISALAVFTVGASISIGTGILLNILDDKFSLTSTLQRKINELQESFNKKIAQIEDKYDNFMYQFLEELRIGLWQMANASGSRIPYEYFKY